MRKEEKTNQPIGFVDKISTAPNAPNDDAAVTHDGGHVGCVAIHVHEITVSTNRAVGDSECNVVEVENLDSQPTHDVSSH